MQERPVGKTRDVGWQIGVSRTIAADLDTAWRYLVSSRGLAVWLGEGVETPLATGRSFQTGDGTTGEIRSLHERDRIRLTWQLVGRPDPATVQIALTPSSSGCTFRFHTEKLYDESEREFMRRHWRSVADAIEADLVRD